MYPSCDPKGRHGGRCRPTMFTKQVSRSWTVWIPYRGRRGREDRANSKKDLVTGPIRGFCAPQGQGHEGIKCRLHRSEGTSEPRVNPRRFTALSRAYVQDLLGGATRSRLLVE